MYLALDLELNNAPDHSTPDPKIIQVGVAIGEPWAITTRSWYVNPHETIYPNITELTGITDHHVEHESVPLDVVAKELSELIQQYKPFVNPVTWGGGDMPALARRPPVGRAAADGHDWPVPSAVDGPDWQNCAGAGYQFGCS